MLMELLLDAFGWKTLTSKNASWPVFQKPLARMSRRALGSVLAERCENDSPVTGCSGGSVAALWQISVNMVAVMSRIS